MKNLGKYRNMSVEELEEEARALSEQLFKLRFQKATGQLENVHKIRQVRKDLARLRTLVREREIASVASR